MNLISGHSIPDPIVEAFLAVKVAIKRITELTSKTGDRFVMETCLQAQGVLITLDVGMVLQAYNYGFAQNGLTVVLLRWKHLTNKDWQEITEVILRDDDLWKRTASEEPSIISASYRGGSRVRPWNTMPPVRAFRVLI